MLSLAVTIMLRICTACPVFKKLCYTCPDCNSRVVISARSLVTLSSVELTRKKTKSGKLQDTARTKGKDKWTSKHSSPASPARRGKDYFHAKHRRSPYIFSEKYKWIYQQQYPPFEQHWSKRKVKKGLEKGDLVEGVISVGRRNSFFFSNKGPGFYIANQWDRNRALNKDIVVVQPYPPHMWKEVPPWRNKLAGTSNHSINSDGNFKESTVNATVSGRTKDDDDLDVPCDEPWLTEAEEPESCEERSKVATTKGSSVVLQTAKVVRIVRRNHDMLCSGSIKIWDEKMALFAPVDIKLPMIVVPLDNWLVDVMNSKKLHEMQFQCRIVDWLENSPHAVGKILGKFGIEEEIETQSRRILVRHRISTDDFSAAALRCLPANVTEWKIPMEEVRKRRDFRKHCVFSIDPATAHDLDDALHCTQLSHGVYEVGVHIADVSYFVKADTALDREAADRATSVYLVQRAVPMLPRQLCENLCSLNPNEDRLSFSIVWKLSDKGELLDQWIGRSMIRSVAKLSYDHAQMMIDDPAHSWKCEDFPSIVDEGMVPHVVKSVLKLNKLAKTLRSKRKENGSLHMDKNELKFTLSPDSIAPVGVHLHQHQDSNKLIEEFMLLANMTVAQHLIETCPQKSLLRYHPPPKTSALNNLKSLCTTMGINLNTTTAGTLQHSLDGFVSDLTDRGVGAAEAAMQKQVLIYNCLLSMEFARYFCTGTMDKDASYHHYALNVSHYTHFTSPIRRYADLLVHRILASSIGEGPPFTMPCDTLQKHAKHCNIMKRVSRLAGEASNQLYLAIYLKELGQKWTGPGMVSAVTESSFDIYIPEFGLVERMLCTNLALKKHEYHMTSQGPVLALTWNDTSAPVQVLSMFTRVQLTLRCVHKPTAQVEVSLCPVEIKENHSGDVLADK